ncbi:MAG: hypothetical protein NW220_24225 [Leptolyngbyaceae cyanobacterium bins.349]|nr:hypothetical protein [Leptolyngbyaceae cyanobacterium bins.349]
MALLVVMLPVHAQIQPNGNEVDGFPVVLDGREVFRVRHGLPEGISAEARAKVVSERLQQYAKDFMAADPTPFEKPISYTTSSVTNPAIADPKITIVRADTEARNGVDQGVLFTARDQDITGLKNAIGNPISREEFAQNVGAAINTAVANYRERQSTKSTAVNIVGGILLALLGLLVITLISNRSNFNRSNFAGQRLNPIRWLQGILILIALLGFVWLATLGFPDVNSILLGETLGSQVVQQFQSLLQTFIQYIPNLVILIVIACITFLVIWLAKLVIIELAEDDRLTAFDREWMHPTVNLMALIIGAVGVVLAIPYLPGFGSPTFLVILVILGILLIVSSYAIAANAIAGLVLMYSPTLQDGRQVSIRNPMDRLNTLDPTRGILEGTLHKYLFVSSLTLPSGQEVFIPNAALLNSYVLVQAPATPGPNHAETTPQA